MRSDIDHMGIRELHFDAALGRQIFTHAARAHWYAKSLAPVHSGEYARRMFVRGGYGKSSSAVYGTESYKGWWVEYGSINNGAYHVLTAAAQLAGMKVAYRSVPGGGPLK